MENSQDKQPLLGKNSSPEKVDLNPEELSPEKRFSSEVKDQKDLPQPSSELKELQEVLKSISKILPIREPGQGHGHKRRPEGRDRKSRGFEESQKGEERQKIDENKEKDSELTFKDEEQTEVDRDSTEKIERAEKFRQHGRRKHEELSGRSEQEIPEDVKFEMAKSKKHGKMKGPGGGHHSHMPTLPKDSHFNKILQLPNKDFVFAGPKIFKLRNIQPGQKQPNRKITEGEITCLSFTSFKKDLLELVFGDSTGNLIRFSFKDLKHEKTYKIFNGPVKKLSFSKFLYSAGDSLVRFDDEWKSEVIYKHQVFDCDGLFNDLAFCSVNGVEIWNDNVKIVVSHERFDKVSLGEGIIAAGNNSFIKIWKIEKDEAKEFKSIGLRSNVKSFKFSKSGEEIGFLNEKGEAIVMKLSGNLKPKVLTQSSGIRDVCWNENLNEVYFLSGEIFDKITLPEWTDEYELELPNKIDSFDISEKYYAWASNQEIILYSQPEKASKVLFSGNIIKVQFNSSALFALISDTDHNKILKFDLENFDSVLLIDKVNKISNFVVNDDHIVYIEADGLIWIFDLNTSNNFSIKKTNKKNEKKNIICGSNNLQAFKTCFYISNENFLFKFLYQEVQNQRLMFIRDMKGKIQLAKVSPDETIVLKTEPPPSENSEDEQDSSILNEKDKSTDLKKNHLQDSTNKDPSLLTTNSSTFKLFYPYREKFVKEFTFHSSPITDFGFTPNNLYFLASSEDCKLSLWSRETLSLITYLDYQKPIINFSLTTDSSQLFILQDKKVSLMTNPAGAKSFQIMGPDQSISYDFLTYLKKIYEHSEKDEASRILQCPYKENMDKYILSPSMINALHFYAAYQYNDAYNKALQNNSSFHNTQLGQNPFSLALWRDEQDLVLKTINMKCTVAENDPFVFGFVNSKTLVELNKRGYPGSESFYEAIYQPFIRIGLPKYVNNEDLLPITVYSDVAEPNKKNFLSERDYNPQVFPVVFHSACIKINMIPGSQESLDLLKSFVACPNQEIFTKPFIKILLLEKWKQVKWMMLIQAAVYLAYIICLMGFIIFYPNVHSEEQSSTLSTVFLFFGEIFNSLLAVYEIYQITQMKLDYFRDVWNYVDLIRFLSYTLLMITALASDSTLMHSTLFLLLEVVVILLTWIRGLTFFRLFDSVRYLTALIFEVLHDMLSFIILAGYSLVGLSLMLFACSYSNEQENYINFLGFTYMTTIGEYSSFGKDIQDFPSLGVMIFTLTSIINTIVMMNLLISIIGDTFDRVQQGRNVTDFKELISMILEMETLMYWEREKNKTVYLQRLSVKYGVGDDIGVWEGRMRELMKIINFVRTDVNTSLKMMGKGKDEGNTDVNKRIEDLERKHEQDVVEIKKCLMKICMKLGA